MRSAAAIQQLGSAYQVSSRGTLCLGGGREREKGGRAYKPPNQRTPAIWTLRRVGIFKVRITGRGKYRTITSKTMLMAATAME